MHWHGAATLKFYWKKNRWQRFTQPKEILKVLNAVLESVWVMQPSITHRNELSQKIDKAQNHPFAFVTGT